jgi:hypothetical protein
MSAPLSEFVDGLSVFMKGTPEEKLECKCPYIVIFVSIQLTFYGLIVSFKLYDMDHDGYLTQSELERVMTQLVCNLHLPYYQPYPISAFAVMSLF